MKLKILLENHFVPEEVASVIEVFRLSLTPEKCQNYINKLDGVNLSCMKWLVTC